MRRAVPLLLVLSLTAAACAVRSDRSTPLVSIPTGVITDDMNVGSGECLVTVGEPHGVRLTAVDETGPSAGIAEVDDVITSFGGTATPEATDLVDAVRSHAIGETVPFVVTRQGQTIDLQVTLVENPSLAGTPRMGVEGLTVNDQQRVAALPDADDSFIGPLTRVVDIGTQFVVFDPIGVRWGQLHLDATADRAFTVIGTEVYLVVADATTLVVTATATSTGRSVTLSTGDWQPVRLLPPLDGLLVLGAQKADATRTAGVDTAIIAVDPATGSLVWSLEIDDQTSGSILPSVGFGDPYADRIEVDLTQMDGSGPYTHVLVEPTADRSAVATVTVGIPDTSAALGWSARDRVLWGVSNLLFESNPISGITEPVDLALGDTVPVGQWPVGDGQHVLVYDGTTLLSIAIGGTAVRTLTANCPTPGIAGPGWGTSG